MKRAPLRTFEHPLEARFFSGTRSWSATNSATADPGIRAISLGILT